MTIDQMLETVPAYAKDLKLNLQVLLKQAELTEQQTWGTVVAATIAARNTKLTEVLLPEAEKHLTPEAFNGAKSAAALMGMNNVYYRFTHMVPGEKYPTIPARLRMQAIRTHGTDPVDFELWCIAVSAINNCQACVTSHERVVLEKGMTAETIVASVRIAAVVHALASVFDAEAAVPATVAAL
jgi:alkyl hydroperoxide reductase subunit D